MSSSFCESWIVPAAAQTSRPYVLFWYNSHLFTQQFKIQMQCVQYATYNSLGEGAARHEVYKQQPWYKEKEKTRENKIKVKC